MLIIVDDYVNAGVEIDTEIDDKVDYEIRIDEVVGEF